MTEFCRGHVGRRQLAQTLETGKDVHARTPAVSTIRRVGVATYPRLDRLALRLETEEDLRARRPPVSTSRRVGVAIHPRLDWLALRLETEEDL